MKKSAYSLHSEDWKNILEELGYSPRVLEFWLQGLYKDRSYWDRHISIHLMNELTTKFDFELPKISRILSSEDQTTKFQIQFPDGLEVETVLIPFNKRFTVCLSTQVGCAMNCSFCFTGTQGLKRHLTSGEIIGQYIVAKNCALTELKSLIHPRIVFMGQGEPLHNFDEVLKATQIFTDKNILALGPREITLSTVGHLPGLKKIFLFPRINLALSLHSPFETERSHLIPINDKYSLKDVLCALDQIPLIEKRIITYEYLMIKNFNMSEEHALELKKILGHRRAVINLIPFNPFPGTKWERPTKDEIDDFRARLVQHKLRVLIRTTKGDDILAACGQLKINKWAKDNGRDNRF